MNRPPISMTLRITLAALALVFSGAAAADGALQTAPWSNPVPNPAPVATVQVQPDTPRPASTVIEQPPAAQIGPSLAAPIEPAQAAVIDEAEADLWNRIRAGFAMDEIDSTGEESP